MVDREVVETGLAALSVAAGELMEDTHDLAVGALPSDLASRIEHFAVIQQVGREIALLAEAAQVLIRRSTQ